MVDYQQPAARVSQIQLPFIQQVQDSVPEGEKDNQLLHRQDEADKTLNLSY